MSTLSLNVALERPAFALRVNQPLWYQIVVWTSAISCVVALLGLVLGVIQWRRTQPFRLAAAVPYAGWMRWHYLTGAVFGVFALTWAGWNYFTDALAIREQTFNADPIPVYPFKFFIPFAGAMLLLQGLVEIARCILCIRDGFWPSREQDVEEVDVEKLKAMVHVKDEDIAALDAVVVRQERAKP